LLRADNIQYNSIPAPLSELEIIGKVISTPLLFENIEQSS
jgi:hypothetical protein